MLTRKSPSTLTRMFGRATVALLALGFSYSIWAQKPAERSPDAATIQAAESIAHEDAVPKTPDPASKSAATARTSFLQSEYRPAWQVDFLAQANPPDEC